MSFAEMVVPYRDPTPDHYRRTAFDIGEWGLGFMTTSLELGCDCLGEIRYLDAVVHDSRGEPQTIRNAICIHEEDNAVLWKHVDHRTGAEVRRARRLVVSFHVTVANYEYLVYWRFYQDGNIECEVRATGIMVTTPFAERRAAAVRHAGRPADLRAVSTSTSSSPGSTSTSTGRTTPSYMSESEPLPIGPDNPHGLGLVLRYAAAAHRAEGGQDYRLGHPAGLEGRQPTASPTAWAPRSATSSSPAPPAADARPERRRCCAGPRRIEHTLWVTPYARDERWPCGEFVNQSAEDTGPPGVDGGGPARSTDTDVVLWYVFGIHHITRLEDWPIMPVDTVSFWLKPFGFFDRNPSLDVAPSRCHVRGAAMSELAREASAQPRSGAAQLRRRRVRPAADGGYDGRLINPATGEVYAAAPLSGAADVDAACRRGRARVRGSWRDAPRRASGRPGAAARSPTRSRPNGERLVAAEAENTGKPSG